VSLRIVPVSWDAACEFVTVWHRHLAPPLRSIFRHAVADDQDILRGVALTGRPVARHFDDGLTLEITRVATDGTRNASSLLYGAAARTCKGSGYYRVITYNLDKESGASLRAAGFVEVAKRKARPGWDMPGRPREDRGADGVERGLWERICNQDARAWTTASRPSEPGEQPPLTLFEEAS
jgi:hypothetical protein